MNGKLIVVLCVTLTVFFSSVVFGDYDQQMVESFSIPNYVSGSSGWCNTSGSGGAWVNLYLYQHTVEQTGWSFWSHHNDTSLFTMCLNATGAVLDTAPAGSDKKTQRLDLLHDGVDLHEWLVLSYYKYPQGPARLLINGDFRISPAELTDATVDYHEYESFSWEDETMWTANFTFHGHFIAPTLAEAQAMGAPYAQDVPEPSTFVTIFGGLLAVIGLYLRRRA